MRGAPSLTSAVFALWCAFAAFALEKQPSPCDVVARAACPADWPLALRTAPAA